MYNTPKRRFYNGSGGGSGSNASTPSRGVKGQGTTTSEAEQMLSPSFLMEQGLSLLGLSPTSSSADYDASSGAGTRTGTATGRQQRKMSRSPSYRRQRGSRSPLHKQNSVQFFASDDASIADLYPYDHNEADIANANRGINATATAATTAAASYNNFDNGIVGNSNSNSNDNPPLNANGRKAKIRRRKLNWRVGPLQRIRKPKQKPPPQRLSSRSSSNSSFNSNEDNLSIAEKTVRSYHTFHSTETIKVGNNNNNNNSSSNNNITNNVPNKNNMAIAQQLLQQQQKQQRQHETRPIQTASMLISPRTPTQPSKKTISSSYQTYSISTPQTVSSAASAASTPSSFSDDENDISYDDGTVITPLEVSPSEDNHRTIGLFLYDSESHNNNNNSYNNNKENRSNYVKQMKRLGRPPRSPFVTMKSSGDLEQNIDNHFKNDDDDDDDSESNESGGPLWQLAKLQAISEGVIPSPPMDGSETPPSSNRPYLSSNASSSRSLSSNHSSSTNPEEIQMGQAERNLKAIHSLAQQHLKFGELPEAIVVLQEMLRGVKELHGEYHYRVGTVLHNISSVYMRAKHYKKAVQYCRQAIEVRKESLGELHPDLAVSLSQLGIAYLELQEYDFAIQNFQEALIIRRETLSYDDPKIARLLNNIGCSYYESGKLEEAEKAFEEALIIQKSLMHGAGPAVMRGTKAGNDHITEVLLSIASTLCNLGSVKLRWKKYDEALLSFEEALLLQQSLLEDSHPLVISTKDSIDLVNSSRKDKNKKRGFVNNLTESLKDLKLNNPTTKPACGFPQQGTSFRDLFSDVMSMKKADWSEILEDLIGSQKLCNVDTTLATNDPNIIPDQSVSDDESHHDFYLI